MKIDYNNKWASLEIYFKERISYATYDEADLIFKVGVLESFGFQSWLLGKHVKQLERAIVVSARWSSRIFINRINGFKKWKNGI